jgi:hypothetical protein
MPRRLRPSSLGSAPLVLGLTLVFLGAIASAIPPAPIETAGGDAERGMLVGHTLVIDRLAEQLASSGYSYIAVDLSTADPQGAALWRGRIDEVAKRRFPIWGWVDVSKGLERAPSLAQSLNLQGFFLYGPDADAAAAKLRAQRPALRVLPVLRYGDALPSGGEFAVALEFDQFLAHAAEFENPVLLAAFLTQEQIAQARAATDGSYLVALRFVDR